MTPPPCVPMGLFDRAKSWLGMSSDANDDGSDALSKPHDGDADETSAKPRTTLETRRDGRERPALPDIEKAPTTGVDDALEAREQGDMEGARRLLREADRGRGLRTVLRAAAALEAGDEAELATLLGAVAKEEPSYRLPLQVAAALEEKALAQPFLARAEREGAPAWALAWARVLSEDADERRRGLVDLLFEDAPLARTVAARDLKLEAVEADADGLQRYASFVHGRESIRRFDAKIVAQLLERAGLGGLS